MAGAADPAGPLAIIGAMTVASATHRASGPLTANRGFELPLTNLAAAAALAAPGQAGSGSARRFSGGLTAAAVAGGALLAAGSLAKMLTAARDRAGEAQPGPRAQPVPGAAPDSTPDANTEPRTARP